MTQDVQLTQVVFTVHSLPFVKSVCENCQVLCAPLIYADVYGYGYTAAMLENRPQDMILPRTVCGCNCKTSSINVQGLAKDSDQLTAEITEACESK